MFFTGRAGEGGVELRQTEQFFGQPIPANTVHGPIPFKFP